MDDLFGLRGKRALVTGGTKGIGKGIASGLARAGADIVLIARREQPDTVAEIKAMGVDCRFLPFDLSDTGGITRLVETVLKDIGQIDILVNCAGAQIRHPSEDFPAEDWNFVLRVNLDAAFFLCQAFGKEMLNRGYGKIINVASLLSFQGGVTIPAYAASKGGIMQFTKTLSNEWSRRGVNVNCLVPGYVDTELNVALMGDADRSRQILERIPQGRWGTPEDFAGPAVFMASHASDYMNGSAVTIDGGWMGR